MTGSLQRRQRLWGLRVIVVAVALGPMGTAWGEDSIFDAIADVVKRFAIPGRADADAEDVSVEEFLVNQATPHLRRILDVELHFADKVCQFNAEQLAALKEVGEVEVESIAAQNPDLQINNNGRVVANGHVRFLIQNDGNAPIAALGGMGGAAGMVVVMGAQGVNQPDSRDLLTNALQQKIEELVPAEVAERYREEFAGRERAKREAAREMMMMHIDRRLTLTPQQYDAVAAAIDKHWNEAWPTNMQAYLNEEHVPMPHANVLRPHLTAPQRAMWQERANQGRVDFVSAHGLGLGMPWGNVQGEFLILDAE